MNRISSSTIQSARGPQSRRILSATIGVLVAATACALPARAAQDTSVAAAETSPAIVQGDHDFLQRIESHMPDTPVARAQSTPPAPAPAAVVTRQPAPIAEESATVTRAETIAPREVVTTQPAPAPAYSKSAGTAGTVNREVAATTRRDAALSSERDVEPRRETVTRPSRTVTGTRSRSVALEDDLAIDAMPAATARVERSYVVDQPPSVERRVVYSGDEYVPQPPDQGYVEIRTRHHGFFHRLFHGR